jgi:DNA polymerase-3 subunit alpha
VEFLQKWSRETGKKSDPRIQFNSFKLLHDVLDSFAKKLSIQLNLNEIDNHKLERLNNIIDSFKGDHRLNFVVYDTEEKIKLDMLSENKKVNISQELLDELDKEKIYFKLN